MEDGSWPRIDPTDPDRGTDPAIVLTLRDQTKNIYIHFSANNAWILRGGWYL